MPGASGSGGWTVKVVPVRFKCTWNLNAVGAHSVLQIFSPTGTFGLCFHICCSNYSGNLLGGSGLGMNIGRNLTGVAYNHIRGTDIHRNFLAHIASNLFANKGHIRAAPGLGM